MRKTLVAVLLALGVLLCAAPAFAYENLCANNPDPTARIKCWRSGPAFTGYVPAQAAVRCPDKSNACFDAVLSRWAYCIAYAQSGGVAYAGTRGYAAAPPPQWPVTVQKVDATLTVPPYGPQSMKPNYPKLIAAEGFAVDFFGNNPAEATSYVMNMCLDERLF